MEQMRLGKTELLISRTGFGALPIQRVDFDTAQLLLRKAYNAGITFFDTANMYSDSEEKIGYALADVRKEIIIASKSGATNRKAVLEHIDLSLKRMKTGYIDILQLHNPEVLPDNEDPESSYAALVEAKKKGKIRFIGITCHKYDNAVKAIESGLYDTVQYPLSLISSDRELQIIDLCKKHDIGLIAMKALCGGIISNASAAFTFLRQFENLVPIWGVQREEELDEFLSLEANPPDLDEKMKAIIEKDRSQLSGDFCRGCGYCMPCPEDIQINWVARMPLLLRRAPTAAFLTEVWQEKMKRTEACTECGQCIEQCPYDLDTPRLLKEAYEDYKTFLKEE
ncbi:MAG: aldo/keto reductase [bacterium]|nr:aldo/keto reductase [bacterium]